MGRFLAIDYGEKRVGLAVSDNYQVIATKLATVSTLEIFPFLSDYLSREVVDAIVIGNPKQMDNTPSESAKAVHTFAMNICSEFPDIDTYFVDERYTSKIASQTIAKSGMKKKKRQDKGLIDTIAAVVILQDFMTMYKNGVELDKIN